MRSLAWGAGALLVVAFLVAGIVLRPDVLLPQKLEQGQVSFHAGYGLENRCAHDRLSEIAAAVAKMPGEAWSMRHRVQFGHNAVTFGVSQAMVGGFATLVGMPAAPLTFNRSHPPYISQVTTLRAQNFCEDKLLAARKASLRLTFAVLHEIGHSVQGMQAGENRADLPDWLLEGHADAMALAGLGWNLDRCAQLAAVQAVSGQSRGQLLVLATVRPAESPVVQFSDGTAWPSGYVLARLMVQTLPQGGSLNLSALAPYANAPAAALDRVLAACRG